jgi:hypothetical protein
MAAKYQWDMEKVEEEEGNVTNSMGMLTSIPEMDLGMEWVFALYSAMGQS